MNLFIRIYMWLAIRLRGLMRVNHFYFLLFATSSIILISSLIMSHIENISMADAVWWAFVTITTVGYGDVSPSTPGGRIIAAILMIVGIGCLSLLTSTITSIIIGGHRYSGRNNVGRLSLVEIKRNLDYFDSLSKEDVDKICRILVALKDDDSKKNS